MGLMIFFKVGRGAYGLGVVQEGAKERRIFKRAASRCRSLFRKGLTSMYEVVDAIQALSWSGVC
jgi:hypothetical protein